MSAPALRKVPPGAIRALANDGIGPTRIAKILKINRETVRRYLGPDYRKRPASGAVALLDCVVQAAMR